MIEVLKFKIEDLAINKKYLAQLVAKDKENEKASMFYSESKIRKLFAKCKSWRLY